MLVQFLNQHSFYHTDFHFGENLSHQQALHNLSTAGSFLVDYLKRPGFHILPVELLNSAGLDANITVLIGHLYHCLENKRTLLSSSSTSSLSRVTSEPSFTKRTLCKTRLRRSVSTHTLPSPQCSVEEPRRSFTVTTHSTLPMAAIAAGLPVIPASSNSAQDYTINLDMCPPPTVSPPSQPSPKLQTLCAVYDRLLECDRQALELVRDERVRLLQCEDLQHSTSLSTFPGSPIAAPTVSLALPADNPWTQSAVSLCISVVAPLILSVCIG